VTDPCVHALHTSLQLRYKKGAPAREEARQALVEKALRSGPDSLSAKEKMALLNDPFHLAELHRRVWNIEDEKQAALWGLSQPPID
jgi:membrane glycosyltransferase